MAITVTVSESPTYVTVNETNNSVILNQSDNPITVSTSLDLIGGTASNITVEAHGSVITDGSVQDALETLADQFFRSDTAPTGQ